jgi:hypothetical protein
MGKGKPPNWFMGKSKPPKPATKIGRQNHPPKPFLPNHPAQITRPKLSTKPFATKPFGTKPVAGKTVSRATVSRETLEE